MQMASLPILTVLEHSRVSPPPNTVGDTSLPLTFFDIYWVPRRPVIHLFLYELPITKTDFIETIVPNIKHSLSITLQHFFLRAGQLTVFPTRDRKPEIRYVQGDSVAVTFAECNNIDFDDITGNHPRTCDTFYQLIPRLGKCVKLPEYVKIPVFLLQVTLLSNRGITIGMTTHHGLCDALSQFYFLKAWTSVARCGTDESLLANGNLPIYDRLVKYPDLDDIFLKQANIETLFNQDYQPLHLSGPTDKVRAKFVLTRTIINQLKKHISTHVPTLPYVSSLIAACAYIWCCIAKAKNDELHVFCIAIDCRTRIDPPIPEAYFGNCVLGCKILTNTALLRGNEGLLTAATLLGENLLKMLSNEDGILKYGIQMNELSSESTMPTSDIAISGSPKLKFYDLDFGWGKPKKIETISNDFSQTISVDACKDSYQDMEIGVSLIASQMQAFVCYFEEGLKSFI